MMARHTHIVSLGLFHKTFHSSLLQETFCFLMYDVLLSIYKINLIKKYIMRYIYVWQPLFNPPPRFPIRSETRAHHPSYFRRVRIITILKCHALIVSTQLYNGAKIIRFVIYAAPCVFLSRATSHLSCIMQRRCTSHR